MCRPVPLSWLGFLDKARDLDRDRLSLREAAEMGAELQINGEEELVAMLEFFTHLGLLMHYNTAGLRELVVLRPQWLLDHMCLLLCHRHLGWILGTEHPVATGRQLNMQPGLPSVEDPAARAAVLCLKKEGRLEPGLVLSSLWPDISGGERWAVLEYMVHFNLCCRLPQESGMCVVPALLLGSLSLSDPASWSSASLNR